MNNTSGDADEKEVPAPVEPGTATEETSPKAGEMDYIREVFEQLHAEHLLPDIHYRYRVHYGFTGFFYFMEKEDQSEKKPLVIRGDLEPVMSDVVDYCAVDQKWTDIIIGKNAAGNLLVRYEENEPMS